MLADGSTTRPWLAYALFAALLAAAVVPGIIAVAGLSWPYDVDGFRDLAIAQAIRDGGSPLADPFYRDEIAWYSPLVPSIVALVAAVSGASIPSTFVHAGAWLNALAPIAYFVCARTLVGAWAALAATALFLFLPGRPPAWASATYSPWLFPAITAQAALFGGLALWTTTLERVSVRRLLAAGAIAGVAFLAHSGAAALLGGVIVTTAWAVTKVSTPRLRILTWIVPSLIAFAVAAPWLLALGTRYGFEVINRAPGVWIYEAAQPEAALGGWTRPGALIQVAIALLGLAWIQRQVRPVSVAIIAAWGAVALALYSHAALAQTRDIPSIVPAYHFFFMLRAWWWLVVGCGIAAVAEYATQRGPALVRRTATHNVLAFAVVLVAVALYPRYLGREAFTLARQQSHAFERSPERAAYEWIRESAPQGAVFAAADEDGIRIVAPAGKQVVSLGPLFSNPYVSYDERAAARDAIFAALRRGDRPALEPFQQRFGVTHVLARGEDADRLRAQAHLLIPVFTSGGLTILQLVAPSTPARRGEP